MGFLLAIFLFALWSSVFPIGKWVVGFSTPVFLTGTRMLLAGILLTGFLLIKKPIALKLNKRQWMSIILLGIFSIYLTNILEFYGLKHLSAAKTCFIYSLTPFFAALFSFLHFNEKMTKNKWLGLCIGFSGMVPVFLTGDKSELKAIFSIITLPELAVVGAALFSIYGWVLLRAVVKDSEISPLSANGLSMLIGGSLALIHSLLTESWTPFPIVAGGAIPMMEGVLILTLLSNIFCYNLYGYLLKRFTATLMSFFGLLSPIFASLTSYMLLGEPISWTIVLSTGIVGIGLYTVYRAELKQGYIRQRESALKPTK